MACNLGGFSASNYDYIRALRARWQCQIGVFSETQLGEAADAADVKVKLSAHSLLFENAPRTFAADGRLTRAMYGVAIASFDPSITLHRLDGSSVGVLVASIYRRGYRPFLLIAVYAPTNQQHLQIPSEDGIPEGRDCMGPVA